MSVSDVLTPLFRVFTMDELERLKDASGDARPHPLATLLGDLHKPSQVAHNTASATKRILRHDETWLKKIRRRLLDQSDPTNAAGAFAEIRAYGAMLEAGLDVVPLNTKKGQPTADFRCSSTDIDVIIEVHCRQLSNETQKSIDEHKKELKRRFEESSTSGAVMGGPLVIRPLGDPKGGRTVTAKAISTICQMKGEEKQFSNRSANVLWIDLQDDHAFHGMLGEDIASPIRSWDGKFTSGELWYALYGWIGAPIFEQFPDVPLREPFRMEHDGRYNRTDQPTLLSAVIATFPRATVLLEHPSPTTVLPDSFREKAMLLPWVKVERSLCNFEPTLVKKIVKQQKRLIIAVRRAFFNKESQRTA